MDPIKIEDYQGHFFRIIGQTDQSQIAAMTLETGEDSGEGNLHPGDQVVYIVSGKAEITVDNLTHKMTAGMALIIPKGSPHRIFNSESENVVIFNVYAPPAY